MPPPLSSAPQAPASTIPYVDSPSFGPVYAIRDAQDLEELRAIRKPKFPQPVGQYLRDHGLLTQAELDEALALQRRMRGRRIGWVMKTLGLFDEQTLGRALAAHAGVHHVELRRYKASEDFRPLLPGEKWHGRGVAILHRQEEHGWIAVIDVTDSQVTADIAATLERPVLRVMATQGDIQEFLSSERHGGDWVNSADLDWTAP